MVGYTKFLLVKHFNNTDRGDFGWGRDGTPQNPTKPSKVNFKRSLEIPTINKENVQIIFGLSCKYCGL